MCTSCQNVQIMNLYRGQIWHNKNITHISCQLFPLLLMSSTWLGHPIDLFPLNLNSISLLGVLVLSVFVAWPNLYHLSSDSINKFWIPIYSLEIFILSLLVFTQYFTLLSYSLFGFYISLYKDMFILVWCI